MSFKDRSYLPGLSREYDFWESNVFGVTGDGGHLAVHARHSYVLPASHSLGCAAGLFVSPSAKWWEQLGAYGSISTLQVVLRGKNVICKFCRTKEALANATTMFKRILVCQKCPADVLFCFFLQILHGCHWEGWKSTRSSSPLSWLQTERKTLFGGCFCSLSFIIKGCLIIPK